MWYIFEKATATAEMSLGANRELSSSRVERKLVNAIVFLIKLIEKLDFSRFPLFLVDLQYLDKNDSHRK